MKSVRLLNLPAAGFLAMTLGLPALAQEQQPGTAAQASELVAMVMAEDQTALFDALAALEATLEQTTAAVEEADLNLYETKIEAATALLAVFERERALRQAEIVKCRAAEQVATLISELDDLNDLPPSQEVNSDIEFVEEELVTLRNIEAGAGADLVRARLQLETAKQDAASTEGEVEKAEDTFLHEKHKLGVVKESISAANKSFDRERAEVEAVTAALPKEKRDALRRSLRSVLQDDFMLVNIDAEHLKTVQDENYSVRQIEYLTQALRVEAEYKQIAHATGDRRIFDLAVREKQRYLAEIDRLAAEQFDAEQGEKSAFGIASQPEASAKTATPR